MTRFARAKGSKSSNLKAPDDSTPWEVMKEQLLQAKKESEESKKREEAENQRMENYSNFLKEQKVQKRQATWCDFPEAEVQKNKSPKKRKITKQSNSGKPSQTCENSDITSKNDIEGAASNEESLNGNKTKKKKQKQKQKKVESESTEHNNNQLDSQKPEENVNDNAAISKKKNKNKNNMSKNMLQVSTEPQDQSGVDNETQNNQTKEGKGKKNKKKNWETNTNKNDHTDKQVHNNFNGAQKKKDNKKRGDKPIRRKEINDNSFQLIINGKEVELIRYDGFPIMKRDAERIDELKTSMMKKGIPKSEVFRTIKLERRRAEKALARLKRDVCYNCRKGGHNLSDCPDLKSSIPGVEAADGLCFKCGSTEHRQFECKVQRDKEFRFASCFICKEQGHIARQCPDNPKGLYPNGGCCKLCGDVTHLRKDCPTVQNTKEETSIKLPTLDSGTNIEDMEFKLKPSTNTTEVLKKPKKITF